MSCLGGPPRWLERGKFLGRRAALECQREPFVVVPVLPAPKGSRSCLEFLEALPAPELLLIDPMAPLDFAVLLRPSGANVSVADPGGFDPQHEGEGEFLPVVTLQPFDGEWEGPLELSEECEARSVMQPSVKPQHAEARTVIQGGVLKCPAA